MVKIVSRKIFIKATICCFCLFLISCSDTEDSKVKPTKPKFSLVKTPEVNKDSVFSFVQKQVDFGPRTPNSSAHQKCADWMVEKLMSYNFKVFEQKGKQLAYDGENLIYRNIIGRFDLSKKKRILLSAHWDTRPWADQDFERTDEPIDGANDGGSGVGVLLEIARQLRINPAEIGVDIIFFDGEDYGKPNGIQSMQKDYLEWCLGSQYWSNKPHRYGYSARFGILLDMVGAKNAEFNKEGTSMKYAPHVVRKVWSRANELGYGHRFLNEETPVTIDDNFFVGADDLPDTNEENI